MAEGFVRLFLRVDGLVLLVVATIGFASQHRSWALFALLLFVPDIFMVGYLANPTLGAFLYNLGHSYLLPAVTTLVGLWVAAPVVTAIGAIWFAHVGLDRFLGYGLKYHDSFQHTHLGLIGRRQQ